MPDSHDLGVLISGANPLIALETRDENGALEFLRRLARDRDCDLYRWSVTDGLQSFRFALQLESSAEYDEPESVLDYIKGRAQSGIYVLCDIHPWVEDNHRNIRLLKDIAIKHANGQVRTILLGREFSVPKDLEGYIVRQALALPKPAEILRLVKEQAKLWALKNAGTKVRYDQVALTTLAESLRGLSASEVKRLSYHAIVDDGAITESDLPGVNAAKFSLLESNSVMGYAFETENFDNIAGMSNLKQWLDERRSAFIEGGATVDRPKGLLMVGVQGGGKSLAAKSVAGTWQVPMLKLDMGALYNKFYGETERNLRDALKQAEAMSPCVIWIDEIEKGLASDDNDSGLSKRVLGTLLTWMQERESAVFLVATSNDISALPPELLRKGRFDEIFFVDLPDQEVRERIFHIHLKKRDFDPGEFALTELSVITEGFSGAEIEQVVVSALYAHSRNGGSPLDTAALKREIEITAPLSAVMAEKLGWLRHWAEERNLRKV